MAVGIVHGHAVGRPGHGEDDEADDGLEGNQPAALGPEDVEQGWRPGQNVDPTIMVDGAWTPVFDPLSSDARRAITESLLGAWLEKNMQYQTGRYFRVGLPQQNYAAPARYGSISGSKVWEAAPQFLAAGVDPDLVRQLQTWGTAYTNTAARFQYSPGSSRPKSPAQKKSGTQ